MIISVAEMEAEMQKQRTRTLDILAEKEEELKMIKLVYYLLKKL